MGEILLLKQQGKDIKKVYISLPSFDEVKHEMKCNTLKWPGSAPLMSLLLLQEAQSAGRPTSGRRVRVARWAALPQLKRQLSAGLFKPPV